MTTHISNIIGCFVSLALMFVVAASSLAQEGGQAKYDHARAMLAAGFSNDQQKTKYSMLMREAFDAGHIEAGYQLALEIKNGVLEKHPKKATAWFGVAAEKGHPFAQFELGKRLEAGIGIEANKEFAMGWYGRAANQGHLQACRNIIRLFEDGNGDAKHLPGWRARLKEIQSGKLPRIDVPKLEFPSEKFPKVAEGFEVEPKYFLMNKEELEKHIADGHAGAKFGLAAMMAYEQLGEDEKDPMIGKLKSQAQQAAYGPALRDLVVFAQHQEEYEYDAAKEIARRHCVGIYRRALKGDPYAMYDLVSIRYHCGEVAEVPKLSNADKFELVAKAAQAGVPRAQAEMSKVFLFANYGQKESVSKEEYWALEAAKSGKGQGGLVLADAFASGKSRVGRKKQIKRAIHLYQTVANHGRVVDVLQAKFSLGSIFLYGDKKFRDVKQGLQMLTECGELGIDEGSAYYSLGDVYSDGELIERDLKTAAGYYLKSAEQENYHAMIKIEKCYREGIGVKQDIQKADYWRKIIDEE